MACSSYDRHDLVAEDKWGALLEIIEAYDSGKDSFTIYGAKASYNDNSGLYGSVDQDERSRVTISSYESW